MASKTRATRVIQLEWPQGVAMGADARIIVIVEPTIWYILTKIANTHSIHNLEKVLGRMWSTSCSKSWKRC